MKNVKAREIVKKKGGEFGQKHVLCMIGGKVQRGGRGGGRGRNAEKNMKFICHFPGCTLWNGTVGAAAR